MKNDWYIGKRLAICKRKGFTLIEVLVVLAILAILATIVFVSIGNQRQRARLTGAASSVKSAMTLAAACAMFDGTVRQPSAQGGNQLCEGSSQVSASIVWPALSGNCFYCTIESNNITFRCSGSCGGIGGGDSYCNYDSTQCVQNN